jgi:hypothetical protein
MESTTRIGDPALDPPEFVAELDATVSRALAGLGLASAAGEPAPAITIADLLVVALQNELEACEEAALWLTGERDLDVKLALARQCGDEARHFRLIQERLRALGRDPAAIDPLARGHSPMFEFLGSLTTTVERVAAGPFAREGLARVRNEVFIEYCESRGDRETASLYRDVIQPDERFHHDLGRRLLLRLAVGGETQAAARRAAGRTLELAGELQEVARLKLGICRAPGC